MNTLCNTPSGLPAISPTRGEKTYCPRLPRLKLGGRAWLSPPPCGEGLGGDFLFSIGGSL